MKNNCFIFATFRFFKKMYSSEKLRCGTTGKFGAQLSQIRKKLAQEKSNKFAKSQYYVLEMEID